MHLTKSDLLQAHTIAQVDRKYILIKTPAGVKPSLVLVDQHAASERCILERLLRDLCQPWDATSHEHQPSTKGGVTSAIRTKPFRKSIRVELPSSELSLLMQRIHRFADWGILYDVETAPHPGSNDAGEINFIAAPDAIHERSMTEPRLLIELIRNDLWSGPGKASYSPHADQAGNFAHHSLAAPERPTWIESIGSCPKGLLDMISSRACRSAVMFNDPLSVDEARNLISELSTCTFPFMCAHGRVSMVPLLSLPDGQSEGNPYSRDTLQTSSQSFVTAFGKWQQSTP